MIVRMELSRILIRELNDLQLIELREVQPAASGDTPHTLEEPPTHRSFPIVIGLPEAQAIDRRLKGIPVKRPQTHDLLASVITAMGGTLRSITINDLSEHTFFATLDVSDREGKLVRIDSRPSDAIAIGVANNVPIYVEDHVLAAAMKDESEES